MYVDKRWLTMELATIGAALVALAIYRLPFITMPIALVLWYMGMDLTPLIADWLKQHQVDTGSDFISFWNLRLWVSVWFGAATILVSFLVDVSTRGEKDFAFWPYFAGLVSFWFGLFLMDSSTEWNKAVWAMINITLIFMGPFLMRKLFVVAGGVGLFAYIMGQALRHVDSMGFLFLLLLVGGSLMGLGLLWYRYEKTIERHTAWMVPRKLRERWLPV